MDLREPVNAMTHGFWAIVMLAPLAVLARAAWPFPRAVVGVALYAIGLIFSFSASGYFHGLQGTDAQVAFAQTLDHVGIHLFIAGTWTVFALVALPMRLALPLLGTIWFLACFGSGLRVGMGKVPVLWATGIYLLMGWCSLMCHRHLVRGLTRGELVKLWIGGIVYSIGAVVNALQAPNLFPGFLGYHELFHLLVIVASLIHFVAVAELVWRSRREKLFAQRRDAFSGSQHALRKCIHAGLPTTSEIS
jgi:hemolysin III